MCQERARVAQGFSSRRLIEFGEIYDGARAGEFIGNATTSGGGLSSMHPNITPARLAKLRRSDRRVFDAEESATPRLCPPQEAESVGQFGKKTKQFYGTLIVPLTTYIVSL